MKKTNLILVGFMGTGKSTAGRLLARRLSFSFVDMDQVIEEREGRPISAIFSQAGEPSFRRLERALVQELSARENLVIATGGGVVLNPENIRDFERTGVVVCLTAKPEVILRRVAAENHRPLLEGDDKARRIMDLLQQRRPLYEALPNRVDTAEHSPEEVVARVLDIWQTCAGV